MAFGRTKPSKSRYITHLATSPSQNSPTNSVEEAFFVHLALEKALKAVVCRVTRDTPPEFHNLVRLSELAGLEPSRDQLDTLAQMNAFNIEGRYSDMIQPSPTSAEVRVYLARLGGLSVVDQSIATTARDYLRALERQGIAVRFGVIFGFVPEEWRSDGVTLIWWLYRPSSTT